MTDAYAHDQKHNGENRGRITIAILAFMGLLITYVETMITPALPVFINVFNTNYDTLSWVLTAYIITGTTAAALFGKLADILGKKRIFLSLAIVYLIAVSFGGFVHTIGELIAVRAVQGVGFGMFPIAFALLSDQVPREKLALAQGIISSTFAGGSAVGLVGGAWITQNFGWEWSYHSAIPLAFGLVIFASIFLKDYATPRKEKIDTLGIGSLAVGLTTLIFALSEGQFKGWYSYEIVGLFIASFVSFFVFVRAESHVEKPFIDMKLLKIRNVFLANFTGLFALAALFFLFYSIPPLLQDPSPAGFGESIFNSGLVLLPASILVMVFAPISARITTHRGPKVAILIGSVILFLAYLGLLFNRGSVLSISEDSAILGMGMSFIFVGVINILLISIPVSRSGEATGMNVVFRNIGMSLAPAIGGVLETTYTTNVLVGVLPQKLGSLPVTPILASFPSSQAFDSIYLVGIIFLIVGIIFTLMMKNVIVGKGGRK